MSTPDDRPTISLTVLSGPDLGLRRAFERERITIGRGGSNDFSLSDGFISNFHGELLLESGRILYRDLKSRHGSLVCVDNVSFHLHNKEEPTSIKINDGTEIQLGCTLMRLELQATPRPSSPPPGVPQASSAPTDTSRPSPPAHGFAPPEGSAHTERDPSGMRETLITASHKSVPALTHQLDPTDKRLAVIFRLAGVLNGLNQLDEILDHIVDATFDAFPAANFFSITLLDDAVANIETTSPLMTRRRATEDTDPGAPRTEDAPIISKSIVKRVVESRESVLFVKDSLGAEVSQSIIDAKITAALCAPLVGQRSLLGVMEVDTRAQGSLFSKKDLELFNIVASLAAFALERAKLSENIVEMFESFVYASVNAIEARDPTTAGHSERVATYTLELAEVANEIEVGSIGAIRLSIDELTELRYAALLHDFGKIAVREDVLRKARRLPELHLDLIAQRFETIKALAYREHVEGPLRDSIERERALTPHELDELMGRHDNLCERLDDALSWLNEVASVGWMSDEAVARVRQLGELTYTDAHGHKIPYLTPFEVENLTIRKGTLNEEEWENMRAHASFSEDYLERIPWSDELLNVPCIAGAHHEKLDGSGYPQGLGAAEIIPQVRMLTIADIFDALTASDRPYRKAASVERACMILREEAEQDKLDADLVSLFEDQVISRIIRHIPSLQ